MKILNLYSGVGGNRALWRECEVTAVDVDRDTLDIYSELYPGDIAIHADAREFLRQNFKNYDFIWASPPCQTHSRFRLTKEPEYVNLALYELIIFLQTYSKGLYLVENVEPYYPILIPAIKRGRHRLWSNFYIPEFNVPDVDISSASMEHLRSSYGYANISIKATREQLRNMCHPKIGKEILYAAEQALSTPTLCYQSDWLRRDKRDNSEMRN